MKKQWRKQGLIVAALGLAFVCHSAVAEEIIIVVRNMQQDDGLRITPVFLATQDGSFDFFDPGSAASESLERLAEDGNVGPMIEDARNSGKVGQAMATMGGPIGPGEIRMLRFEVDPDNPLTQYLSLAAMAIPSNDAFIGTAGSRMIDLFSDDGRLIIRSGPNAMMIRGDAVWDAGTEVNDEIPANVPLLGQMEPNTGDDENGVVHLHGGFMGSLRLGGATGNILAAFPDADFTHPRTPVLSISVLPGNVLACDDVDTFTATCEDGKAKIRVRAVDASHDGQMVVLNVNGGQFPVRISGKKAMLTLKNVRGPLNVGLAGPAGCLPMLTTDCR